MTTIISASVELTLYRCGECKRYYQIETDANSGCSWCLKRRCESLNARNSELRFERDGLVQKYERTIAGLRGALTKSKGKKR